MRYSDIDAILKPWAASRSLHIFTEHKEEEVRIMIIVDDAGDTYHLYAGPDPEDPNYPDTRLASVGVSLAQRGNKKYHAFYRERRRFSFAQTVPLSQLSAALDASWQRLHEWIAEAGHTRTPA